MITLAETYPRERQAGEQEGRCIGEQEGRQQALSEYVRLFWDEATTRPFVSTCPRWMPFFGPRSALCMWPIKKGAIRCSCWSRATDWHPSRRMMRHRPRSRSR